MGKVLSTLGFLAGLFAVIVFTNIWRVEIDLMLFMIVISLISVGLNLNGLMRAYIDEKASSGSRQVKTKANK